MGPSQNNVLLQGCILSVPPPQKGGDYLLPSGYLT